MPAPMAGVDGAWGCASCQNVNFATRDSCNRCQTPRDGSSAGAFGCGGGGCGARGGGGAPAAGVDGNWQCGQCGNVNFPNRMACNRCQAPPSGFMGGKGGQGKGGKPMAGLDGNWPCPSCSNVNYATRAACNRCQAPRPAQMMMQMGKGAGKNAKGAPIAGAGGNWACPSCSNVNFSQRTECNRCQTPKPEGLVDDFSQFLGAQQGFGGAPAAGVGGNWECVSCKNVNFATRDACNRCQAPKSDSDPFGSWSAITAAAAAAPAAGGGNGRPVAGVDGNWSCPGCSNVNFASRDACNRCQTPKPEYEEVDTGLLGGELGAPPSKKSKVYE